MRLIEGLSFSYDGAPDSKNGCPVCGERMWWHNLQPFETPNWLECEDCQLLANVESEECFWYGDVTDDQFEAVRQYWLSQSELTVIQ